MLGMSEENYVKRRWLCLYSMESELDPVDRPCQIIVELMRHEKPPGRGSRKVWTLKEKTIEVN